MGDLYWQIERCDIEICVCVKYEYDYYPECFSTTDQWSHPLHPYTIRLTLLDKTMIISSCVHKFILIHILYLMFVNMIDYNHFPEILFHRVLSYQLFSSHMSTNNVIKNWHSSIDPRIANVVVDLSILFYYNKYVGRSGRRNQNYFMF